jgi:hypothetical protein
LPGKAGVTVSGDLLQPESDREKINMVPMNICVDEESILCIIEKIID